MKEANINLIKGFVKLKKDPKLESFGIDKIVLENSILKNTEWVLGMALFMKSESLQRRKKISSSASKKNAFRGMLNHFMSIFFIQIIVLALVNNIFLYFFNKNIH